MRVSLQEKERLSDIAGEAIEKLNSPKNSVKSHWSSHDLFYLQKRLQDEQWELDDAISRMKVSEITDECYDNINFCLMIIDNLKGNK